MNSGIKKILNNEYVQIVTGLLFGIFLFFFFINKNSFLGLISIIGFLLIIANIIRLIDATYGRKTNLKNLFIGLFLAPFLLGLFLGTVVNMFEHLENTINGSDLFFEFGTYSILAAVIVTIISYSLKPKETRKFSFTVIFAALIVFPLLFISGATFLNRYKADNVEYPVETIVTEKESKIDEEDDSDSQFSIYTTVGLYKEEFTVEPELWHILEKNDTIVLYLKNGNLGFTIVDRIEKKTPKIPTPSPSKEGNSF